MEELQQLKRLIDEQLVGNRKHFAMADMLLARLAEKLQPAPAKPDAKPEGGK
jgi:hypothetical protein